MMSSRELPYDVVIDILSRLPVKTLIRFRCVCKSWYATISHPNFISTHLNRASFYNESYLQYIKWVSWKKQKWCLLSDQTYLNHVELEIPLVCRAKRFKLVGTFNGLVCLSHLDDFSHIIFLWNPSIRKFKTLTCSSIAPRFSAPYNDVVLGFGFQHQTNDYKVVRILYFRGADWRYIEEPPHQVEVYTLSTDSWRRIEAVVPCFLYNGLSKNAFINGSVHWVASSLVPNERSEMILSFDIGDEVFREMKLPNYYIDEVEEVRLSLDVLKESLSLYVCFPFEENLPIGRTYIWVMREYGVVESWTKQFTIVLEENVERSLGFTKNNELLLETVNKELVSYDLESLQLNYIGIRGCGYSGGVISFMETLVLLEGENALLGQENSFDGVSSEGICLGKRKL